MEEPRMVAWSEAVNLLWDGDMLLFGDDTDPAVSEPIRVGGGGSKAYHVGTFTWRRDRDGRSVQALCLEMVQGAGGRAYPLQRYVEDYPGTITVYRPDAKDVLGYDRQRCVEYFWDNYLGKPYGNRSIWRFLRCFAVGLRWLCRPSRDDAEAVVNPVCSSSRASQDRAAGVDPVPNRADGYTSPGDLERSALYTKLFTLMPDTVSADKEVKRRPVWPLVFGCLFVAGAAVGLATTFFLSW